MEEQSNYIKKYRWTLKSKRLSPNLMKFVEFDFKTKILTMEVYEVIINNKIDIHDWAESDISDEIFEFTTYDGCGQVLYEYEISNMEIMSDISIFDYDVYEIATRKIVLKYNTIIKK